MNRTRPTHSLSFVQEQKHLLICRRVDLEHRRRAAVQGKNKCTEWLKVFDDPHTTAEVKKKIELDIRKQAIAYQRAQITASRNSLRKL